MVKNELTVKDVDFLGDTLKVARDESGIVWAGVKWLCDGIGLSKGQMQSERKKIQEDAVLSKGERNFILPTTGGNQEVLCLQLDYVPLWLAKISITPNMRKNNPEAAEKLVTYQLKAKDALAAAFLPTENKQSPSSAGTPIRLYKNNKWYILTIGNEVYNLAPDEAKIISKAVSAMLKNGVAQIEGVVRTMVESFDRDCELKCARECVVGIDKAALEDKARGKGGDGDE